MRKICDFCQKRFDPQYNHTRYCSTVCRRKAYWNRNGRRKLKEIRERRKTDTHFRAKCRKWARRYYENNVDKCRKKARMSEMFPEKAAKIRLANRIRYANNSQAMCKKRNRNRIRLHQNEPWIRTLQSAHKSATWGKNKRQFTLTREWCRARWTGKCEVTKIPFRLGLQKTGTRLFNPSIDRIDNSKGYTPDNCRFVLHAVNSLKADGTDETMLVIAKAIVANISQ